MGPLLYTQVYCLCDDEVLLMQRHKEPNLGLWVAPGGKIEKDESPCECAFRELNEETSLRAHKLFFRGLVSIVSPSIEQPCLQFVYVVTDFSGKLVADEREGALRWLPLAEAQQLPMPQANTIFFPRVIDLGQPFYQAKYIYDADWHITEVLEHSVHQTETFCVIT